MPMVESQADDQVTSGLEHSVATDEAADLKSIFNLAFPTNTLKWRHPKCSNIISSKILPATICSNEFLPDSISCNDIYVNICFDDSLV